MQTSNRLIFSIQITIYFARWLAVRVPRDPVKISCSLLFDFFYKHLTHRGYCYNDNTVTDDFEICQKFFLKQYLPLVFPLKISKLSFSLDSRRLFSRFSWSRNIFLILEIISWDLGNMELTGPEIRLTASHENVKKSSTHQVANIANMHRKSQKREAKNVTQLLGTLIASHLAK